MKSTRNPSRRTVLATGAAAAATLGMPGIARAADTFKIGLIASYTGAFATWGPQFENAINAFQAINGKTVKGPKGEEITVQIVPRDAASGGADKAKQLAEELILREKVQMLAGFELSPHALAVGSTITEAKIPTVIMNAATASITRTSPYFVRTSDTLPQWAAIMGQYAAESGKKTAVTMTADYATGNDAAEYFKKHFEKGGGKVIGVEKNPMTETNFSVYMEKVLQVKPDCIYMFQGGGSPSISFVKAYTERGLKQAGIQLMGGGEFAELYLPNFTDDVIGVLSSNHYTETNDLPENKVMKDQLTKMYGAKGATDIASVGAWDGMQFIYMALRENGAKADGLSYIKSMVGKEIKSPRGPIMLDPEEREIIENIYIRRIEKRDGKLTNIDIKTYPMVKDPWKLDNPVKK